MSVYADETKETKENMEVYNIDLHDSTPLDTLKKDVLNTYLKENPGVSSTDIDLSLSTLKTSDINWNKTGLQTISVKLQVVHTDANGKAIYPLGYDYSATATVNLKKDGAPQVILKSSEVTLDLNGTFNYADNLVINSDFSELPVLSETDNVDTNTEGTYTVTVKALSVKSTSTLTYSVIVRKSQEQLQAEQEAQRAIHQQEVSNVPTYEEVAPVSYASLPAMGSGNDVVSFALSLVGSAYSYGGTSPLTGFDCSGFTQYVYSQFGIELPHSSGGQSQMGTLVDPSEAQPGDLVTYYGHSAIYIGDGLVVNALNPAYGVNVLGMYSISNGGLQVHRLG